MGVGTEELNGIERLSIINYLLNGNTKHYLELENLTTEQLRGGTTKDLIAPKEFG